MLNEFALEPVKCIINLNINTLTMTTYLKKVTILKMTIVCLEILSCNCLIYTLPKAPTTYQFKQNFLSLFHTLYLPPKKSSMKNFLQRLHITLLNNNLKSIHMIFAGIVNRFDLILLAPEPLSEQKQINHHLHRK
jgi:hypothetical protein